MVCLWLQTLLFVPYFKLDFIKDIELMALFLYFDDFFDEGLCFRERGLIPVFNFKFYKFGLLRITISWILTRGWVWGKLILFCMIILWKIYIIVLWICYFIKFWFVLVYWFWFIFQFDCMVFAIRGKSNSFFG